jgi:hypothetical protein
LRHQPIQQRFEPATLFQCRPVLEGLPKGRFDLDAELGQLLGSLVPGGELLRVQVGDELPQPLRLDSRHGLEPACEESDGFLARVGQGPNGGARLGRVGISKILSRREVLIALHLQAFQLSVSNA